MKSCLNVWQVLIYQQEIQTIYEDPNFGLNYLMFLVVFVLVSNIWNFPTMDNSLRLLKTLGITYISKDQRKIAKLQKRHFV